jgi:flagellar basal body-associated protein FliL
MPDPQVRPAPSKTKRRVAVVFVVVLGGAGIFFWMRPLVPTNAAENNSAVGFTFPLETFVVNLNGGERAYLRVGIAVGLSRPPARKEELPVALVRDTILSVLSSVRPEQLTQPEGKSKLKAEILQALKDRAPQLGVEDVYFTEFLVQM